MGQRANLIIVENRQYTLYYSHWCANTITRDLFWGPEHAIRFIQMQREIDDSGWLDDVWAEGAAVVDCDKRILLLYGGEDETYDVPVRRAYLKMLRRVWSPWEVRWAHEGIADIADYVGYPRSKVLAKDKCEASCSLSTPEQRDWTCTMGSFGLVMGELVMYPLDLRVESYLLAGSRLVTQCESSMGVAFLPLDEWINEGFPTGGFHVDLAAQTLDYWTARDIPGIPKQVCETWRDWKVTWHRDHFEAQLEAAQGRLRFPTRSTQQLQAQLTDLLLGEYGRSSVDALLDMTEREREEGKDVEINPWALRDVRLEIPMGERQRIMKIALGS